AEHGNNAGKPGIGSGYYHFSPNSKKFGENVRFIVFRMLEPLIRALDISEGMLSRAQALGLPTVQFAHIAPAEAWSEMEVAVMVAQGG
ncbi:MAG: hypothetical protein JRI25_23775, partial [Deltaproteobacteria bacterium]|nr:hypothetical protein [Deltaproteobacteria bacterium]